MKTKKLLSILLTLCMLLSAVPMMTFTASAETDYASQGYVAYVVPHTLNADGTVADTDRPTTGTFDVYQYDATGVTVVTSATTVNYDGLKVTDSGETRYYYKSVDAAMAVAQAGETNTGYATSSNKNGVITEGTKDGTYESNDYLNPDLGDYTDTVVLLGDVDGYLYNYVKNQDQLGDWLEDGAVSAEKYSELADTQKYGIHKGIIVDLNGYTVGGISGGIIPKNETLIIKNGTVSGSGTNIVGSSAYDDENWAGSLTGNVVFSGITLSGNIYSGNHGFIFLDGKYNPEISFGETATGIQPYSGYYVNDPAKMGTNVDILNFHVQAKADADDAANWPDGYNYRILNGASSYNVKLDTNAGDNTVLNDGNAYTGETLAKTFKTNISLPAGLTVQDRSDVTFLGWSSDKYATSAEYTDTLNDDIAQSADETVTLYAIWSGTKVTDITLNPTEKTVNLSEDNLTFDITATVTPSNAYNQDIVYSSSNKNVATVDEDGKVTVINRGTAIITATADCDKNIYATFTVTANHDKHTWSYTANGDTLTAVCEVTGCDYSGNKSLKISWNGTSAVLTGADGQTATELAGQDSLPTIHYEGTSGTTYSSTAAPTADGTYMATVTAGNATAVCDFSIGQSVSYLCPVYKSTTGSFYEKAAAGIEDEWRTSYCKDPTAINNGTTKLTAGWYIVRGKISTSAITVSGNVNIILEDGCELTVNGGILVSDDNNSLTVYAQSIGSSMGKLTAKASECTAAIGGAYQQSNGPITINGGTVTATGDSSGAGIGGGGDCSAGFCGSCSNIVVNGGTVTATGGDYGGGIGGGYGANNITINGGIVTATGVISAAGIGGGSASYGSYITITGGTVTATGVYSGAGIGGGSYGYGSYITITGGTVTATGGSYGAGIGGGYFGSASNIKIGVDVTDLSGFVKVLAIGGSNVSGIGSGAYAATATGIKVNTNLVTKADLLSNPPTTVIANNGNDLASALNNKRYALIDHGLGELTVSGTTVADKEYDGTTDATVTLGTVTGIAEGDEVEVIATAEFDSANAGTQNVTVSYTLSGKDAGKYNAPAAEKLSATITQKYLIIELGNIEGYVGDTLAEDGAFTFTADGLAEGDTVTPAFDKTNININVAGTYSISLSSYEIKDASDNDVKGNYNIICQKGAYYVHTTETKGIAYSASLTLNKNIDVNLKMKNLGDDCDPTKIGVTVDGEEVDVTYDETDKTLSCVLKAVEPKDIGTKLNITVTYNGKLVKVFTYSVASYCNAVFNVQAKDGTGKYDKLAELCEALLNYGKYAKDNYYEQKYGEGIFTSTLNDGYEIDLSKVKVETVDGSSSTATNAEASLTLGSTISLNFYVTDTVTENQVTIFNNNNEQVEAKRIQVESIDKDGYKTKITINNIYVEQMSRTYTLKVNGKSIITYGVYNYCYDVNQMEPDETYTDTLKTLCKAIYNYGETAKAFAESQA